MAQLIDGKAVAARVRAEVKAEVDRLKAEQGLVPGLAVVRVGEDPASKTYVTGKKKAAEEVGFRSWEHHRDSTVSQDELLALVRRLNEDPAVHGVLVQLPLPRHIDPDVIISAVRPEKDVDGFHPLNAGNLVLGRPATRACTPLGVMRLLEEIGCEPSGKRAVVVGRSNIVGKPMALMLLQRNATVTLCHSKSDLPSEVSRADILVVAAGVRELVKGAWIKPGAVVIDVGMNRKEEDGKLVGDVEFQAAAERASFITPVPGGVGPMTIAMLIRNTLEAAVRGGGPSSA
ncbi:bifunctional methylenetetrahydrofolate dehydrogenase/methenyltetrahydrofolate cyclohydrolase FolD [Myxococcus sp. MISCRS1]|jgi:methylenetetrahydrofolate dehydrogenase (NADP+)/methenyltetrahydrofolate cyclohydrolase|uniref:bifunctional methylenetetrahydrofolate dehydrogenase/methenyltetrahydrofolate cyclohydrolase FolD n=1 Tax=Myxococcus TaxID=32 RepID=UPI001CBB7DE9|nr:MULTISPECIES: bifunctional methylenetetrahydrofolate dehydrogenase/methenyltetrahydrofolate cyclohydrolase FolD [Myxococcus]MBZ4399942.1 bifunctional methylenetetrahydrofolate dehydrogenase/methenyltetrahydrofolate cyclohydrolase FolD [Myxococcus sp. AS-1-15]MCK8496817.1 bifunctional methylenetetrahydrofolate dehydrogenase/methenyltetrahydrofolate cyclohydrolase FolD [Myxococcus fulvus]MCY0995998.1 bifunctional methylenetetrahydrofolate dehydrogenase/methenyltetrahydrofolate cyclohydrolase Fo